MSADHDPTHDSLMRWHRQHWRGLWATVIILVLAGGSLAFVYGERLKEIAHWGHPLTIEEFEDADWNTRWISADTSRWEVRDGRLVNVSTQASFLFWPHVLHGAAAVEFEGELTPGSPPCDLSLVWSPTEPAAGKPIDPHAWWLQVGANNNTHAIIHGGATGGLLAEDPFRLEVGRRYRLRFEIDGDRLSILIDGRLLLAARTDIPLSSGWVGLYTYYSGKAFDHVAVFNKGVPERLMPTAVGDALVELGLHNEAVIAYRRVEESHPGSPSADLAAYRRGLELEQLGRRDDAIEAWKGIADLELAALASCRRIAWDAEANRHDIALSAFQQMTESAPPAARSRLPLVVNDCIKAACQSENGLELVTRWSGLVDRYLPDCLPAKNSLAHAFNQLDRPEIVLERYGDIRAKAADALILLGRTSEVLEHYRDTPFSPASALLAEGRFAELESEYAHIHVSVLRMLCAQNRLPEAMDHWRRAGRYPYREALQSGLYDDVLAQPGTGYIEERSWALLCSDHHDEARALALTSVPENHAQLVLLRLGLPDEALRRTSPEYSEIRRQAWSWILFDALDRSDVARAQEARAALALLPRRLSMELAWFEPWLLTPLAEAPDDAAMFERTVQTLLEQGKKWQMQRPWHVASLLAGKIDDAAFLAQPCSRSAHAALIFAKALLAEHAADRVAAAAAFREYLALPLHQRDWDVVGGLPATDRYAEWRLHVLEKSL